MATTHSHALPPPPGPQPARRRTAPRPVTASAMLQVAVIWRGRIIGYRLLARRRKVTVGRSKWATFVTPPLAGRSRFVLLRPRRGRYVLRLAPELRGDLTLAGTNTPVAAVASREVDLAPGDKAKLLFADGSDLRIEVRWVDPPEVIPRPRFRDPQMMRIAVGTGLVIGVLAALLMLIWEKTAPRPPLALDSQRIATIEAPAALEFEKKQIKKQKEAAAEPSKQKQGQTKRAKERAGRIGRNDATPKDTVIPKGKQDVLREKVQKVGILSILGHDRAAGSGLSKLFAQSNDIERAMAGMAGARMVVGHGSGGLATSGAERGGGGTSYGHIYGSGDLDTGGRGTHGHGRGPKLAERGEREVSVGLGAGGGESDGSLSKEQVYKVVKAHFAGVKYCYEKELQHKSSLSGSVDVYWVIQPDGTVSRANIKSSAMNDAAVEGCILRQVKQWQFPKAPGQTIVGRFPFIFKGGS